jgi:hypothetical protein
MIVGFPIWRHPTIFMDATLWDVLPLTEMLNIASSMNSHLLKKLLHPSVHTSKLQILDDMYDPKVATPADIGCGRYTFLVYIVLPDSILLHLFPITNA